MAGACDGESELWKNFHDVGRAHDLRLDAGRRKEQVDDIACESACRVRALQPDRGET